MTFDKNMAAVAACVGHGRQNAMSLQSLARAAGITTRDVREAVQLINSTGDIVIIRMNRVGYYIPDKPEELINAIRYNDSYRKRLQRKVSGMKRYLVNNFPDGLTEEAGGIGYE